MYALTPGIFKISLASKTFLGLAIHHHNSPVKSNESIEFAPFSQTGFFA